MHRRAESLCAMTLMLALFLTACSGAAGTEHFLFRTTDYLEFADYPDTGQHQTAIGVRELADDGFFFRASTRAELDYSVDSDQLGEMTEALGGQLMQAYTWRLENRYAYDSVELRSEKMEQLLGKPVYHATFRMDEGGAASQSDFYCLAFDGMLCTLEFVFEDTRANRKQMERIVGGMRLSESWGTLPPAYGNDWERDFHEPVYLYYSSEPLEQDNGARYRIDGKLYDLSQPGTGADCLQLYDRYGYFWNVTGDSTQLAEIVGKIRASTDNTSLEGIPVTVFGELSGVQYPPDDSGVPNTPLEAGYALTLRGLYLVIAENAMVCKLA